MVANRKPRINTVEKFINQAVTRVRPLETLAVSALGRGGGGRGGDCQEEKRKEELQVRSSNAKAGGQSAEEDTIMVNGRLLKAIVRSRSTSADTCQLVIHGQEEVILNM